MKTCKIYYCIKIDLLTVIYYLAKTMWTPLFVNICILRLQQAVMFMGSGQHTFLHCYVVTPVLFLLWQVKMSAVWHDSVDYIVHYSSCQPSDLSLRSECDIYPQYSVCPKFSAHYRVNYWVSIIKGLLNEWKRLWFQTQLRWNLGIVKKEGIQKESWQ